MRRLLFLTLAGALAAGPAGAGAAPGIGASSEALHRALAGHALRTLDGQSLTLGSLKGEVVVVNFWASWCAPCRREMPALAALNADLSGQSARVMAISIDEDPRNVQRFLKAGKLSLPVAHDGPDGLARELDLKAVPFTLVLGRDGEIAATSSGAEGMARIAATARELAARKAPAEARPLAGESAGGTP